MPCTNAGLAGGEEGPHVDPHTPAGLDGFFAPVTAAAPVTPAPAPSPLDPDWGYVATPPVRSTSPAPERRLAPRLPTPTPAYPARLPAPAPQPASIELAAPTMSFAPHPTAAPARRGAGPGTHPVLAPRWLLPRHERLRHRPLSPSYRPSPREPRLPSRPSHRRGGQQRRHHFLSDLLLHVLEHKSSDLHLTVGARPTVRQHGHLTPLDAFDVLTPTVVQKTMYAIMSQKQREKFEEELELDFAYSLPGRGPLPRQRLPPA
jgi:twitching motility protein PilT